MSHKNLLVALEPTEEGKHVWHVASRVAKQQAATPHILNVIEPAVTVYADLNFTPLAEHASTWQKDILDANRSYLEAATPCRSKTLTVREGYPAQEITRTANDLNTDLVVMGVHNRRGLKRLLGSTTHNVLNSFERDVLAVHPDSGNRDYKRIIVAVDTTDLADQVLAKAKAFAPEPELVKVVSVLIPLTTVFAVPETGFVSGSSLAQLTDDVRNETQDRVVKSAAKHGFDADVVEIRTGDPRDEIVSAAEAYDADLIVIGSNRRNALNRLLLGSTARGVLNHTPCDVLVCR